MDDLDTARWTAVSTLLDELLELDDTARAARLAALRLEDAALADHAAALLAHAPALDREGFLAGHATALGTSTLVGERLGPWRVVQPLGEGGMGTVWLARRDDGRFEGLAAVKLVARGVGDPGARMRFEREGRILARLAHPNIARLLDAGVTDAGQPYLILEYVEGEPIDRYADRRRLSVRERLDLFLAVAGAVAHAHRNLVLHRDLKPSNILVAHDGTVKLLDFGIAKLIGDEAPDATQVGHRAYTPEYAAPEQVQCEAVTTATDVYGLGVLLYLLLAGRHPTAAQGATPVDRLHAIVHRIPARMSVAVADDRRVAAERHASPRELARALAGDLDTIVAKALAKAPDARYVGADPLADDVRRHLHSEPVQARPPTLAYRAARFAHRHQASVLLASLALVALLAGIAGTWTQARRATAETVVAQSERVRADEAARRANAQLQFALRQLSLADAMNDLDAFLLADAAPGGKPLAVGELLERAERVVESQPAGVDDANRVAMLAAIGSQYATLERTAHAREVLARAYEASRALTDLSVRANAACSYAQALGNDDDRSTANALFTAALAELPAEPQFVRDRLACHWRAAETAARREDREGAIAQAEAAERLLGELQVPSPSWSLRVLMTLAEAYRIGNRNDDAIATFERAHEALRTLGRLRTETASTLYNNWALALGLAGRASEAEAMFRRAMANSSAGAAGDVSPMLMLNYARSLARLDRNEEAEQWVRRADRAAAGAGGQRVLDQGLMVHARIYLQQHRLADAEAAVDAAAVRYARALPPRHPAVASIELTRSLIAEAKGDSAAALRYSEQALARLQGDWPDDYVMADALRRHAALLGARGELDEARSEARRALQLDAKVAGSRAASSYRGASWLVLARIEAAAGHDADARDAADGAAHNLCTTLGERHRDCLAALELRSRTALARATAR